jgi:hypothetical protein
MNRTGKAYVGSYDIWTRNQISHLLDVLSTRFITHPAESDFSGWVNGDQYERSTEVFTLPQQIREHLGLLDFHPLFAKKHDIKHGTLPNSRMLALLSFPFTRRQSAGSSHSSYLKPMVSSRAHVNLIGRQSQHDGRYTQTEKLFFIRYVSQ